MKILFKSSSILFALVLLITSCEDDRILFDTSTKVVGFTSSSVNIPENVPAGKTVELYLGAVSGTEPVTVNLSVLTEGHTNPAVEGVDYTISSKVVNLEVGKASVTIIPIDNSVFEGNKTFDLKLVSSDPSISIANQNSVLVTIQDDEHPLKNWIGTYSVEAVSYDGPGKYDEKWTVTTSPVVDNVNQLQLVGVAGSALPVIVTIDSETLTVTVGTGQALGKVYGATYGEVGVFWGGVLKGATWSTPSSDLYSEAGTVAIVGTITENGSQWLIDDWAHLLTESSGFVYDVFNTTWTKQ